MSGILNIKKAPTPKVDASQVNLPLYERRLTRLQTGEALFFALISLVEKGKQCYEQTTKGYQQADNS